MEEKEKKQKVFDIVLEHSRQMTQQATLGNAGTLCAYRTGDNNKCFFGVLIPDALYDSSMEEQNVENVLSFDGIDKHFEFNDLTTDIKFLRELQYIHDNQFEYREQCLKLLAYIYCLNYYPV